MAERPARRGDPAIGAASSNAQLRIQRIAWDIQEQLFPTGIVIEGEFQVQTNPLLAILAFSMEFTPNTTRMPVHFQP